MNNIQDKLIDLMMAYGPKMVGAILVLIIGFKLTKIMIKMLDSSLNKSSLDVSLHSFIKSIVAFALKIVVLITAATTLGIPMTTFIAVISAAGLAIGLALKDSLSNFAGGVLILTFRPFNVGDFIEAQGYMGTVKEIRLLYTYLATVDNRRVVIPNGELANGKIVNYSVEETRRIDLIFGVSYQDDIIKVKALLNQMIMQHPLIMKEPEPLVRITEHAESSINFIIKVWCKKEDYWDIYYDLHEQVKTMFDREGITIPFPQRDIHMYTKEKL